MLRVFRLLFVLQVRMKIELVELSMYLFCLAPSNAFPLSLFHPEP